MEKETWYYLYEEGSFRMQVPRIHSHPLTSDAMNRAHKIVDNHGKVIKDKGVLLTTDRWAGEPIPIFLAP